VTLDMARARLRRVAEDFRRDFPGVLTFNTAVLTIFGAAALLLATVGIYGLMACAVQQRTQEIGIRIALGADARRVRDMIVWRSAGRGVWRIRRIRLA
jgi:ABC-type antimicrobial peptide transport system permease subunit